MTFETDIRDFATKATAKADMVVRKTVIDIGTSLVLKSPVGDASHWVSKPPKGYTGGRFRANWQYSLGAADTSTTLGIDKTGSATISAITGSVGQQASGKVHYITNSLPYSIRLENGYSRQAPKGMVGLTVTEFSPIIAAAAAAVK